MAMLEMLRGMKGDGLTVHGFRSSFFDWGHDLTGHPKEILDIALAHTVADKVEAAYRRSDMFEKRQLLMADWARYCQSTVGQVKLSANLRKVRSPDSKRASLSHGR